jgi:hypothetical protein
MSRAVIILDPAVERPWNARFYASVESISDQQPDPGSSEGLNKKDGGHLRGHRRLGSGVREDRKSR